MLVLAFAGAPGFAGAQTISESQLKAAFLYNFTKFVEWPPDGLAGNDAPIVIGVLGTTPLLDELRTIVDGRKVNGHPIAVRGVRGDEEIGPLQLLFVSGGEEARFAQLKSGLPPGVLTVGESAEFTAAGGAIRFVEHDGKLRFEIDLPTVEGAGLKLSAELQKLAVALRRAR